METFIARQPILNKKQQVVSYELLFRDGIVNFFCHPDSFEASSQVMSNSVLLFGLDRVTSGKRAFINIPKELLLEGDFAVLPKGFFAIELLEDITIDRAVLKACRDLKTKGYMLIIDDFVEQEGMDELIKLTNIIKIDVLATSPEAQSAIIAKYKQYKVSFLAEKVEDHEAFKQAISIGYEYFQGYFFKKPVLISQKDIPGYKRHYLKLMREISQKDINLAQLEELIKKDVSLPYKLLRYINSAFFGLRVEVKSIRHALVILGEKEIRKWVCLLCMGSMVENKPTELLVTSMLRARFCELLAPIIDMPDQSQDLFLLGLFSLIDGITNKPIGKIIQEIPLTREMKNVLCGKPSPWTDPLMLIVAYELGDWEAVCRKFGQAQMQQKKDP